MQKSKDFFYHFNAILMFTDSDALKRKRALQFFSNMKISKRLF